MPSQELEPILTEARKIRGQNADSLRESIVSQIFQTAEAISSQVVTTNRRTADWDRKLDDLLTSRLFGFPIMLGLLGVILWLTIVGANYPSRWLATFAFRLEGHLSAFLLAAGCPLWLHGALVDGIYRAMAWVVSVMLPPMAIFFPLFTFFEDLGYLPRVAFNLDRLFKKAGAAGKQSLTMCMGLGCNAAGVTACRIIDSPRERLIAILTNNFIPCNGRFPLLIAMGTLFFGEIIRIGSFGASLVILAVVSFGIVITLAVSWLLSKTALKGIPSSFTLELPPFRKPQVGTILIRSLLDRTLHILGRAVIVVAPAGLLTWMLANTSIGGMSLLAKLAGVLEPLGRLAGLDGFILAAFLLGFPANEIVLPILLMGYLSHGVMLEPTSMTALGELLRQNGWTLLTGLNMMLFSLLHFPCGTTLFTIRKETGSGKWTLLSFLLPTLTAFLICIASTQIARFFS
jgi:ferrous iron transport protein B